MTTIQIQRQLQNITASYDLDVEPGYITEINGIYYIPYCLNDLAAPDIVINGVTATATQTKITALAPTGTNPGAFDDIRVGDVVKNLSAGTLTAKSTLTRSCFTVKSLNYVVYPDTYDSSTLGIYSGDAISGTGLDSDTLVDRIDYATRRIFLDKNCTDTGVSTLTITPVIRVTAVRKSTETLDANQIDIDTTVATTGASAILTLTPGAREAVYSVLKVVPIGSTVSGKASFSVSVAILDGTLVKGSASGFNDIAYASLAYSILGTYAIDADSFLVKARIPKPTVI